MKVSKTAVLVVMAALLMPEMAYAAGLGEGVAQKIIALLTGNLARACGLIAIASVGWRWWDGRIKWEPAIAVIGGIVIVFSGAAIMDLASAQ